MAASTLDETIKSTSTELLTRLCRPIARATTTANQKIQKKRRRNVYEDDAADKRTRFEGATTTSSAPAMSDAAGDGDNPDELLRKLKQLCKTYPNEAPPIVCHILLKNHLVNGATSTERERALKYADGLFLRSSKFRSSMCESLRVLLDAVFGENVPGPNPAKLQATASSLLRTWNASFGKHYPQLGLALASQKIPTNQLESSGQPEDLQQRVDLAVTERVQRGFRIFDGAPLSGLGESEASLVATAVAKLEESANCLHLLLPSILHDEVEIFEDGEPADQNEDDGDSIEWEDEAIAESNGTSSDDVREQEEIDPDDAEVGEEDENEEIYIPQDFRLDLLMPSANDNEELESVRQALLDIRLTIEKTLVPQIRVWAESIERVLLKTSDPEIASLLVRVKRLLSDLQTTLARCDRLHVASTRIKQKSSISPS